MGTFGTGIFDDDLASMVRDEYLTLVRDGVPDAQATARVVAEHIAALPADDDHAPLVANAWIALALAQWQVGRPDPAVTQQAIAAIDREADLPLWSAREQPRRRKALADARARLLSPPPARKRVRKPRTVHFELGDVFEVATAKGLGYVQVTHAYEDMGHVVRIVPGLFAERPADLAPVVACLAIGKGTTDVAHFVRSGTFTAVGNFPIPPGDQAWVFLHAWLSPGQHEIECFVAQDAHRRWRIDGAIPDELLRAGDHSLYVDAPGHSLRWRIENQWADWMNPKRIAYQRRHGGALAPPGAAPPAAEGDGVE